MIPRATRLPAFLVALGAVLACTASGQTEQAPLNTLTEAERADGWRLLFDGR